MLAPSYYNRDEIVALHRAYINYEKFEEAVLDGTIDRIITDHAPHSAEEKADFEKAPNGVVGLETSLAATLIKSLL